QGRIDADVMRAYGEQQQAQGQVDARAHRFLRTDRSKMKTSTSSRPTAMPTVRPPSRTQPNIARGRRFSTSSRSMASSLGFSAAVNASTKNSTFITGQPSPAPLHALEGFETPGPDRVDELLVVLLVLVRVAFGEVGDRFVERVTVAEVGGDGDRVSGAGVGAGQGPSADAGVEPEPD